MNASLSDATKAAIINVLRRNADSRMNNVEDGFDIKGQNGAAKASIMLLKAISGEFDEGLRKYLKQIMGKK